MAECIGIIIYFASPVLIAAFNSDPDVVAFGVQQARTVTLFYFLLAFLIVWQAFSGEPENPSSPCLS